MAASAAAALMVPLAVPASADSVISAPLGEGLSGPLGLAVGSRRQAGRKTAKNTRRKNPTARRAAPKAGQLGQDSHPGGDPLQWPQPATYPGDFDGDSALPVGAGG